MIVRSTLVICATVAVCLLCGVSADAQTSGFTVVNGAGYGPVIAPDSWGVILGTGLAQTTAVATLDSTGHWPASLGGTSVQVNGVQAAMYFVSPTQINFLVPSGTAFGTVPVVISNTNGPPTLTGTANLQNTAPAIFSMDGSGAGPGAILNGVTGAPAPFLVQTPENGGADLRTRLAVYATGLRWTGNLTHDPTLINEAANVVAQAADLAGNFYNLTVEYAGPAPGYFGLDQVNVVLPAELDGAGAVTLTLIADLATSNPVTFQMNSLPSVALQVTTLTLSSSFVTGGGTVTGTVGLNGVARAGGFPVTLSNQPGVSTPAVVTISPGRASGQFQVTTQPVVAAQNATITARGGGATVTAALEIDPVVSLQLSGFSVTPGNVQAGQSFSGTVTLSGPVTTGAVNVQLTSDNAAVLPPASVAIAVPNTSTTFAIPTASAASLTTVQTANLTATAGRTSISAGVTVTPVIQLVLSSDTVTGGTSVTGTVTLGQAAPNVGARIALSSTSTSVQPPLTVTIPGGQTSVNFTINTQTVTAAVTATITASYGAAGLAQSASLTVTPVGTPKLISLKIAPTAVNGGSPATGTITLSAPAPAGGVTVVVSSSSPLWAKPPLAPVNVPPGLTSVSFTITTVHPPVPQMLTISATANNVVVSATLTVD
jgi:trimeric autotransporter adhesin